MDTTSKIFSRWAVFAWIAGVCLWAQPAALSQESSKPDERLFLLRVLELMYDAFPIHVADKAELEMELKDLRLQAKQFQDYAKRSGFEPEYGELFDGYIQTLDAFSTMFNRAKHVMQDTSNQSNKDGIVTGAKAGWKGAATYATLKEADVTSENALLGAIAMAGFQAITDSVQKWKAREAAKDQAIASLLNNFEEQLLTTEATRKNIVAQLAKKHGWGHYQLPFSWPPDFLDKLSKGIENQDSVALSKLFREQIKIRPHDPFLRLYLTWAVDLDRNPNYWQLSETAKQCAEAINLIPSAPIYNELRQEFLINAALQADSARASERRAKVEPLGSSATGSFAVSVWMKLLESELKDDEGIIREKLAWALLANGDVEQATKHVEAIFDLRRNEVSFCYLFACLLSRIQKYDGSLQTLETAIKNGLWDLNLIRSEPDFDILKSKRPTQFNKLLEVKYTWRVKFGFLLDDIQFTNTSLFPLTDVTFRPVLKQGTTIWNPELKAPYIMPGETYTWTDVLRIPGNSLTSSNATLICTQNQ